MQAIFQRYLDLLVQEAILPVALGSLSFLILLAWARAVSARRMGPAIRLLDLLQRRPWLPALAVGLLGVLMAISRASVMDDAFISFRYGERWLEGQGLTFNPGERVEGYTNFLWTVGVAAATWLTGFHPPEIAWVLCLVSFAANLYVIYRLGRLLRSAEGGFGLPLATMLAAVQQTMLCFATGGLETMAASLCINLGAFHLVRAQRERDDLKAGAWLIASVFLRPDHAIFYAVGSAVVLADTFKPMARAFGNGNLSGLWKVGIARWAAYATPFSAYAVYLGWKVSYYGAILPNTYWAKSADLPYYSQGKLYASTFYLGSHFWVVVALGALGMLRRSPLAALRRFHLFLAGGWMIYNIYVLKIGGDFMFGRFYVTLIPLMLLAAESAVSRLWEGADAPSAFLRRLGAATATAMLIATAHGTGMIDGKFSGWGQVDEGANYSLKNLAPVEVDHPNWYVGVLLGRMREKGIRPVIATGGIGMVGYYSGLELIDLRGLTDAHVARLPLKKRGRPGHEKFPDLSYLQQRGVHWVRYPFPPEKFQGICKLKFGKGTGRPWYIIRYDRDMMRQVRVRFPEVRFTDFESHLDRYIPRMKRLSREEATSDLAWFRTYYFDHNHDPDRLSRLEAAYSALP